MDIEKFIQEHECVKKINLENKENDYIEIDTGFGHNQLVVSEKLHSNQNNMFRFLDKEILPLFGNRANAGALYLPDHAMNELKDDIFNKNYDRTLADYLPDDVNVKPIVDSIDIQKIIKHADRSKYATSFFTSSFPEQAKKIIDELQQSIPKVRNCKVAFGNIQDETGIIEVSERAKISDPNTYHCSFWKLKELSLNELASGFTKIGE